MKALAPCGGTRASAGTESVRVVVQARPLLPFEAADGATNVLTLNSHPPAVALDDPRGQPAIFEGFDDVYDAAVQPADALHEGSLLQKHVVPLVDSVFAGVNATAFAYGQTSAGKSFTMDHMIASIANEVFHRVGKFDDDMAVTVRIGFIEIYKERIRDLVDGTDTPLGMAGINIQVRERRGKGGGVFLDGAKERVVGNAAEMRQIIADGALLRQTAATGMNSRSSRSHSVITLSVQVEPVGEAGGAKKGTLSAKLHLVDLAGSERAKRTQAGGERFKEGVQINRSLFALAKVISALADNAKLRGGAKKHVPYRDSKLTRLLQDSLGGTARTLLIACVSPASTSREETTGTLRYAARAKSIQNTLKVNVDAHAVEVSDLRAALARARAQVAALAEENEALRGRLGMSCTRTRSAGSGSPAPKQARRLRGPSSPVSSPMRSPETPLRSPEPMIIRRGSLGSPPSPGIGRRSRSGGNIGLAAAADIAFDPAPRALLGPLRSPSEPAKKKSATSVAPHSSSPVTSPRRVSQGGGGAAVSRLRRRRARAVVPPPVHEADGEGDADGDESPHRARVERALGVARTDELRRAFSARAARLEREKAALEREKGALQRKLAAVQAAHNTASSDLRAEKASRAAALRARAMDLRKGSGDAAKARKERDEAMRARKEVEGKLREANRMKEELRGKVAGALARVEAVKKEMGRDNRALARSEAQLKTALERSSILQTQKDAMMARLQAENEVLRRKLRESSRAVAAAQQQQRTGAPMHAFAS